MCAVFSEIFEEPIRSGRPSRIYYVLDLTPFFSHGLVRPIRKPTPVSTPGNPDDYPTVSHSPLPSSQEYRPKSPVGYSLERLCSTTALGSVSALQYVHQNPIPQSRNDARPTSRVICGCVRRTRRRLVSGSRPHQPCHSLRKNAHCAGHQGPFFFATTRAKHGHVDATGVAPTASGGPGRPGPLFSRLFPGRRPSLTVAGWCPTCDSDEAVRGVEHSPRIGRLSIGSVQTPS